MIPFLTLLSKLDKILEVMLRHTASGAQYSLPSSYTSWPPRSHTDPAMVPFGGRISQGSWVTLSPRTKPNGQEQTVTCSLSSEHPGAPIHTDRGWGPSAHPHCPYSTLERPPIQTRGALSPSPAAAVFQVSFSEQPSKAHNQEGRAA